MKTNFGQGLALAAVALFTAMAVLPAVQANPDGDLSRSFYRQETGFIDRKGPVGLIGVTNGEASQCIVAFTGSQVFPLVENYFYYENLRIYGNLKVGLIEVTGPGAIGPVIPCPLPLVVGTPDPIGYQLTISNLNVYATLNELFMSALLGLQRPATETGVATSADWDIGVCPVTASTFAGGPADGKGFDPLGLGVITLGSRTIACSAWTVVRDGNNNLFDFVSGQVQTDEVAAQGSGVDNYFVSCLTNNISWVSTVFPFTGTRVASTSDYALVLDPATPPATIAADVANHLDGTPLGSLFPSIFALQGVYDLGGDNGDPCNATGPADSPLLAKVKP